MTSQVTIQTHLFQLAKLFGRMDEAYDTMAGRLGFHCCGCEDNCCRSLFYHHTVAEYLFIRQGLSQLPDHSRRQIHDRALETVHTAPTTDRKAGVMCPLNEADRCVLYTYRPMICRLHGIPHLVRRPDGTRQTGPGCNEFYRMNSQAGVNRLDRTPWYVELSRLENELRRVTGFSRKLKLTIAQMLVEEVSGIEIHL